METDYESNITNKKLKIIMRQCFVCSVSSVFAVMYGIGIGSPTVIIPQLRKHANNTEDEDIGVASWTSSIINFSGTAWVLVLATLAHYLGRKKTVLFSNTCTFLAFLCLKFSETIIQVLISQAILGITAASSVTISIMLVTEYTSPKYRGMLVTIKAASLYWGILISNTLGTFLHWKAIAFFGIACTAYNFVVIFFIPESPVWLAKNGRIEHCTKSFQWIKGTDSDAKKELSKLINNSRKSTEKSDRSFVNDYIYKYIKATLQPEMYTPFFHCVLLTLLYDWSGKILCTVYSIDMIKKITGDENTAYTGMLILDGFSVLSMYLASIVVKLLKRRTLLITATSICVVLLYSISFYLYLIKLSLIPENNYLIVSMLVMYSISVCCGPIIISDVVYGELIPIRHRSFSFTTIAVGTKIIEAIFLKIAPYIFKYFDVHGTFMIFGTCTTVCMVLLYKLMPETKDKTLQEISIYYKAKEDEVLSELMGTTETNINEKDPEDKKS